jgi:hypothetical protein
LGARLRICLRPERHRPSADKAQASLDQWASLLRALAQLRQRGLIGVIAAGPKRLRARCTVASSFSLSWMSSSVSAVVAWMASHVPGFVDRVEMLPPPSPCLSSAQGLLRVPGDGQRPPPGAAVAFAKGCRPLRIIVRIISARTLSTMMSPRNSHAAGSGRTARNRFQASPTSPKRVRLPRRFRAGFRSPASASPAARSRYGEHVRRPHRSRLRVNDRAAKRRVQRLDKLVELR